MAVFKDNGQEKEGKQSDKAQEEKGATATAEVNPAPPSEESRPPSRDFPLVLTELRAGAKVSIKENSVTYITEEPRMPAVRLTNPTSDDCEFMLHIEPENDRRMQIRDKVKHYSKSRKAEDSLDLSAVIKHGASINLFDLMPKEKLPWGGKFTLNTVRPKGSISFAVRGKNPPKESVIAKAKEIFGDDSFVALSILLQESTEGGKAFNQFHVKDPVTSPSFPRDLPNWGYPGGWGMAQIDPRGTKKVVPTKVLWNWKANLEAFKTEWVGDREYAKRFHARLVEAFGKDPYWSPPPEKSLSSLRITADTVSAIIRYNGVGPLALAQDSHSGGWEYISVALGDKPPQRYKKVIHATWQFNRGLGVKNRWDIVDNGEKYWTETKKKADQTKL